MIAPLENLSETSFITFNLNFPGEETIERVIARYKDDEVLLKISSADLENFGFTVYLLKDGYYYQGTIKHPRDSGFRFEKTPQGMSPRAAFIEYNKVKGIIAIERTGNRILRGLQFVN